MAVIDNGKNNVCGVFIVQNSQNIMYTKLEYCKCQNIYLCQRFGSNCNVQFVSVACQ